MSSERPARPLGINGCWVPGFVDQDPAKCLQMLKDTVETGEELVVTLRGKPLARVMGVRENALRILGGQRGAVDVTTADRDRMPGRAIRFVPAP